LPGSGNRDPNGDGNFDSNGYNGASNPDSDRHSHRD